MKELAPCAPHAPHNWVFVLVVVTHPVVRQTLKTGAMKIVNYQLTNRRTLGFIGKLHLQKDIWNHMACRTHNEFIHYIMINSLLARDLWT